MLEQMIKKKIEELEKEKFKMNIDQDKLLSIDIELETYRGMLDDLKKEEQ